MTFKVTFSTMGVSTPATVSEDAEGGSGYYYKRDRSWTPNDPRYYPDRAEPSREPLPQNVKATTAKQKRFAEFTRLLLEGASKEEAGAAIGVSASTANYYYRDFKDQQQRGEVGDA